MNKRNDKTKGAVPECGLMTALSYSGGLNVGIMDSFNDGEGETRNKSNTSFPPTVGGKICLDQIPGLTIEDTREPGGCSKFVDYSRMRHPSVARDALAAPTSVIAACENNSEYLGTLIDPDELRSAVETMKKLKKLAIDNQPGTEDSTYGKRRNLR